MVWATIAYDLDTLAQQHLSDVATVTDVCTRYSNCSGVACSLNVTLGRTSTYHLNMEVLPCLEPPAVHLLFADNSGNTYYDRNFEKSTVDSFKIPASISSFNVPVTLHVTVHQLPGTVAFAVSLLFTFCNNTAPSLVSIQFLVFIVSMQLFWLFLCSFIMTCVVYVMSIRSDSVNPVTVYREWQC